RNERQRRLAGAPVVRVQLLQQRHGEVDEREVVRAVHPVVAAEIERRAARGHAGQRGSAPAPVRPGYEEAEPGQQPGLNDADDLRVLEYLPELFADAPVEPEHPGTRDRPAEQALVVQCVGGREKFGGADGRTDRRQPFDLPERGIHLVDRRTATQSQDFLRKSAGRPCAGNPELWSTLGSAGAARLPSYGW